MAVLRSLAHEENATISKKPCRPLGLWRGLYRRLLAAAAAALFSAPLAMASGEHKIFELGDFALEGGNETFILRNIVSIIKFGF